MGIPSFYRYLCKTFPKIVTGYMGSTDWLCLDFNCAIYYVLNNFKKDNPDSNKPNWQTKFIQEIIKYLKEIIRVAGPTKGVFVSVDGAVCAAKRRQQRLRRFKSSASPLDPGAWDQNAITPGSAFMEALNVALREVSFEGEDKRIIVSGSDEPGEGEHKIMKFVRDTMKDTANSVIIYGLDADLILLAMLLQADTGCSVSLLREAQEFEDGSSGWRSLNIRALQDALLCSNDPPHIRDFVCAMSLLGNDFLPRSLTHTVRDQGIPELVQILRESVWNKGYHLVKDGSVSVPGLLRIVSLWAHNEVADLRNAVVNAQKAANYPPRVGATLKEIETNETNSAPARWATITQIAPFLQTPSNNVLWTQVYDSWMPGTPNNYLQGIAWIWDYYSGRPVDQAWLFEEHLPPTWTALEHELIRILNDKSGEVCLEPPTLSYHDPLPEKLHLMSVLPMSSIERLLPIQYQAIAQRYPWYWPTTWAVHDVGKTQLWECEPVIPLIPEALLRSLVD